MINKQCSVDLFSPFRNYKLEKLVSAQICFKNEYGAISPDFIQFSPPPPKKKKKKDSSNIF